MGLYDPLFQFPIDHTGAQHAIVVCRHDCQLFAYLLWICKLDTVPPIEAVAAMSKVLTGMAGGAMQEKEFLKFVRLLCPLTRMSKKQTEIEFFTVTVTQFYQKFNLADIDQTIVERKRLVSTAAATIGVFCWTDVACCAFFVVVLSVLHSFFVCLFLLLHPHSVASEVSNAVQWNVVVLPRVQK